MARALSSVGRAPPLQGEGRGIEARSAHYCYDRQPSSGCPGLTAATRRLADRLMSTTPFVGATRLCGATGGSVLRRRHFLAARPADVSPVGGPAMSTTPFRPVGGPVCRWPEFRQATRRFVGATGRRFLEAALLPRQATFVRLAGRLMSTTLLCGQPGGGSWRQHYRRLQNYCEDRRGRVFV